MSTCYDHKVVTMDMLGDNGCEEMLFHYKYPMLHTRYGFLAAIYYID